LTACSTSDKNDEGAVARVYDSYLYASDLKDVVPPGTSKEDSVAIVKKHISNWVSEMLIVKKAEDNLEEEEQNMKKQLDNYRKSLIMYAYEKALVNQQLDTVVDPKEIEKYYNDNPGNFELKDNIIKVVYIKVSRKAPDIEKVKKWYKSDAEKDKTSLDSYCRQFAENFYLDDNAWLLFDDLLKEIPIETYNKELFLKNNRFVEVQDSGSCYFVNIKGFKIKNSLSPLGFEKENIRNIILNKRKLELITKMKADIYQDALANKKLEIYNE